MSPTITIKDISVLMPIKNGINFVKRSLLQISEMAGEAEVIIVDDGSTDGSFEYCQSFSREKLNFKVLKNPGFGICDALNYGITTSSRKWIARFDVDDEYSPNRISEQIKVINSTKASLIFSGYSFYGDGISRIGSISGGVLDAPTKLSLVTGRRTPHPSAIFLREKCLIAGGYRNEDAPAEDLSLWLRLCSLGEFATTETDLLKYRISASSITLINREVSNIQRNAVLRKYPLDVEYFEKVLRDLDSISRQYSRMESPGKRIALLLLDIFVYSRFYDVKIRFSKYWVIIVKLMNVYTLSACFQLFFEARRRNKFRKNLVNRE